MRYLFALFFVLAILMHTTVPAIAADQPAPAVEWIRPSGTADAKPVWGIRGGMSVGLWAGQHPRGLIQIFTPYLKQSDGRVMNFIAVEPVVGGVRDLSEIQTSAIDKKQGKLMAAVDQLDPKAAPKFDAPPACGVITRDGNVETLTVFIVVERFDNGAQPIVRITFRSDRPHEVALATFAADASEPMEFCVLTATMGNFGRLRKIHLKDETVEAAKVFAGKELDGWKFFPWVEWPADRLKRIGTDLTISAIGELDPKDGPAAPPGWQYEGLPATQTWTTAARDGLIARANGRVTFWASEAPIPGGASFENFELKSPFEAGQELRFRIEPE